MIRNPRKSAIIVSLLVTVLMLAGKLTAYLLTYSRALLADAAESVIHAAAVGLAAFSIWYAARPADADHPYGHGRIAYFSAGFEGALVFAASLGVIWSGVAGLIHSPQLRHLGFGLTIAAPLALINLALGLALIRIGRKHKSLILVANGKHALADMWTTLAAIVGVGLVLTTGITWLDPLAALLIGVHIMLAGIRMVRSSYAGLMDEVEPELTRQLLTGLQQQVDAELIAGFHELRCRRLDDAIWVDVHVLLPGEVSMAEGHARVTRLEHSIRELFPDDKLHITSHSEPADHETAHPGGHDDGDDSLA